MKIIIASVCLLLILLPVKGKTKSLESSGKIEFQLRKFKDNNDEPGAHAGLGVLAKLKIESSYSFGHLKFEGLSFVDAKDPDRNKMFIEDFFINSSFFNDELVIRAGYQIFNWSDLEVFHPADVINSIDYDSDLESLDKKGELTLSMEYPILSGEVTLFLWPKIEKSIYPSENSRLGLGTEIADPNWVIDNQVVSKQWNNQFGILVNQSIFKGDYKFHYIKHIDRKTPIIGNHSFAMTPVGTIPENNIVNIPYYYEVVQFGFSLQQELGDFLLKIEAVDKNYQSTKQIAILNTATSAIELKQPLDYQEVATGLEYNYYHENSSESTFLLEYSFIPSHGKQLRSDISVFQNDFFFGHRYNFNNSSSRELFYGFIIDLERSNELFYTLSYSERLWDNLKIKFGFRIYDAPRKNESEVGGMQLLEEADQVYINISNFF